MTSSITVTDDSNFFSLFCTVIQNHICLFILYEEKENKMKSRSISDLSSCVLADKTRLTDGEPADGDDGSIQEVSGAAAGPMTVVRPLQSEDPGNEVLLVMAGCLNTNHQVETM